jgi:transcriptional regulator with XRE-family HTH domain
MAIPVSTPITLPILGNVNASLGHFIKERRERLGWSQKTMAQLVGMPQPALSDIERGATKMPNADLRRRLARTLGVSHLDLLVATGEITAEELAEVGMQGARPAMGADTAELHALVDQVNWGADPTLRGHVEDTLRLILDRQRARRHEPDPDPIGSHS